jgi:hypothetical protein
MGLKQLKRREISCYKPTDLWSPADDLVFLKWVTNEIDRCYHTMSRDLSARPHEILDLKIKDVVFKVAGDKQYALVLLNGKTGSRNVPLIQSISYLKRNVWKVSQFAKPTTTTKGGDGNNMTSQKYSEEEQSNLNEIEELLNKSSIYETIGAGEKLYYDS